MSKSAEISFTKSFSQAVSALRNAPDGKALQKDAEHLRSLCEQAAELAKLSFVAPEPVMVHDINPDTFTSDEAVDRPIVSFTSISQRLPGVRKMVESLILQDSPIHSINMYISEDPFLIDKGIDPKSDHIKELFDMGVNIYNVPNIGPYRKQHFVIWQLRRALAPYSAMFITVDDDVLYPKHIVGMLKNVCREKNCIAAHRGREILFSGRSLSGYNDFIPPRQRLSARNLANGRNGIAYKIGFFPRDSAFYVGPHLAETADDLWCKWVTSFLGIKTFISEPKAAYDPALDFPDVNREDKISLYHSYNARGTNDVAIAALESYFGGMGFTFSEIYGENRDL